MQDNVGGHAQARSPFNIISIETAGAMRVNSGSLPSDVALDNIPIYFQIMQMAGKSSGI